MHKPPTIIYSCNPLKRTSHHIFLKINKLNTATYLTFQGCHLTLNATGSQVPPEILSSCAKGMTFEKITCVDRKTSF